MSLATECAHAVWIEIITNSRSNEPIQVMDARKGDGVLKQYSAEHIKKNLLSGEMGTDINLSVRLSTALTFLNSDVCDKIPVIYIDDTGMVHFLHIPCELTGRSYDARYRINHDRAKIIIQSTLVSSNMLTILNTSDSTVSPDRVVVAHPISDYSTDHVVMLAQACVGMYPEWSGTIAISDFVRDETHPRRGVIHTHESAMLEGPAIVMYGKHDLIEPFSIKDPQ